MKLKRILLAMLALLSIGAGVVGFASCSNPVPGPQGAQGEQGIQGDKGDKGEKGDKGTGIQSVDLDENGNLVITLTDGTKQTVEMPKEEEHVHNFREWRNYTPGEDVFCGQRLFYRICLDCSGIEWKHGTEKDHVYETETIKPTCQEEGYDLKTCTICGNMEMLNYKPISNHAWESKYTYTDSFHWIVCKDCDETKLYGEHTYNESKRCTVCDQSIEPSEGLLYDISADRTYAEVIGYEGTDTSVIIADTYNGLPVKTICERAFYDKGSIKAIFIPDSIISIGDSAFYGCYGLTNVEIPGSVASIGDSAFYGCFNLTSVTISDGVTSIGDSAFYGCDDLTSIVFPDSVESIGDYAFRYCDKLTSVVIGDKIEKVGFKAFEGCDKLIFNKYGNAKYLGNEDNPYYALIEVTNTNYSSFEIHSSTKVIADYAFVDCGRLTSIVIPDSVTSIGVMAFYKCASLTSVVIGEGVASIGSSAFLSCTNLTSVYYKGSMEKWAELCLSSSNSDLTDLTCYYYSETEPTGEGNYWHYDENGEVVVW